MSGWLYKRSTGLIKIYRLRHFTLQSMVLSYKSAVDTPHCTGVFDFNQQSIQLIWRGLKLVLVPLGKAKQIVLKALCLSDSQLWRTLLQMHIRVSTGFLRPIAVVSKRFWKTQTIAEDRFVREVNTGDLLLFRSDQFASKLQRALSGSSYDHVALVLKLDTGEIAVLDATLNDGVSCSLWNYEEMRTSYTRVVLRKLHCSRPQEFMIKLEEFCQEATGQQYHISLGKLMCASSTRKGFFCSELVAAAYQHIGILPKSPPASKYWPSNFCQSSKLPLIEASMSAELVIVPTVNCLN